MFRVNCNLFIQKLTDRLNVLTISQIKQKFELYWPVGRIFSDQKEITIRYNYNYTRHCGSGKINGRIKKMEARKKQQKKEQKNSEQTFQLTVFYFSLVRVSGAIHIGEKCTFNNIIMAVLFQTSERKLAYIFSKISMYT